MTDRYEMTYEVPAPMLQRAMISWARPHKSWRKRLLNLGLVLLAGVVSGVLLALSGVLDLIPGTLILGVGIGFYIGLIVWFIVHRRGVGQLSKLVTDRLKSQGPTQAVFSAEAVEFSTHQSSSRSSWAAFDQVIEMADATALRSGGVIHPIPHFALPDGIDPATFHADITRWHEAGQ